MQHTATRKCVKQTQVEHSAHLSFTFTSAYNLIISPKVPARTGSTTSVPTSVHHLYRPLDVTVVRLFQEPNRNEVDCLCFCMIYVMVPNKNKTADVTKPENVTLVGNHNKLQLSREQSDEASQPVASVPLTKTTRQDSWKQRKEESMYQNKSPQ